MWVRKTSADRRYKEIKILPVQVLYNTCKEVFENFGPGIVPARPENIERLKAAMDGMTGADVGLRPGMQFFRRFPVITYIRIHECDKFSIGLFCLPQSAVIPLHNHPEMTVLSKLLFGTINVNSFEWVNADPPNKGGIFSAVPLRGTNSPRLGSDFKPAGVPRLAKTKAEYEVSAPCKTSVLYPADRGNLHTVRALTPCTFLEVVAPPCSVSRGWPCTYYRKYHFSTLSAVGMISVPEEQRPGYVWLQETEKGDVSLVYKDEYTGPCIVTE
ncbi:hypothetical protein ACET3Z_011321 [Daucus carota]